MATAPKVRKGMPNVQLSKAEFRRRIWSRFYDPVFEQVTSEIETVIEKAWDAYQQYRKNPRTRRAGKAFVDPHFELPLEWLETRRAIHLAEKKRQSKNSPSRILLVNGSSRTDQSCPGEMSKTFRLVNLAKDVISGFQGFEIDILDLSRLTSEYGRVIYPCKACVSTAMPLCHWPCSCYPNHAMGQVNDWMGEIYPLWAGAHGVMIVCPVNWYQAPSSLKLMMDRLVALTAVTRTRPPREEKIQSVPKNLNWKDGVILAIWRVAFFPWWCMETRPAWKS